VRENREGERGKGSERASEGVIASASGEVKSGRSERNEGRGRERMGMIDGFQEARKMLKSRNHFYLQD
jgi:hypothetical protein